MTNPFEAIAKDIDRLAAECREQMAALREQVARLGVELDKFYGHRRKA